jgi:hypothetical protein
VMDHDNSVARQVNVELEAVGAGGQPAVERHDRVFWANPAAATVREDERA